jgi:hypothetical protein
MLRRQNFHYMSYAFNNKNKKKVFYRDAHLFEFFQVSMESIFSKQLIMKCVSDILLQKASFRGFTSSYNYVLTNDLKDKAKLESRRMADCYYTFHLVKYYYEFKNKHLESNMIFYLCGHLQLIITTNEIIL